MDRREPTESTTRTLYARRLGILVLVNNILLAGIGSTWTTRQNGDTVVFTWRMNLNLQLSVPMYDMEVHVSGGSRNGAIGGAVGWRGGRGRGPPTHQQGGMGERCKLPHRGLGRSPRSFHIFRFKAAKNQRIRSAGKEFTYARKTTKFIAS